MRNHRLATPAAARWVGALGVLFGAALTATSSGAATVETLHYLSDPYSQVGSFGVSSLPPFILGSTIVGSITLAAPLTPNMVDQPVAATAYDFNDGTMDRSGADVGGVADFDFSTDASAHITNWFVLADDDIRLGDDFLIASFRIAFLDDGNAINLYDNAGEYICTDAITCDPIADQTAVTLEHGTFTTAFAASAPEPANWAMLICGVGLVGAACRLGRRRPFDGPREPTVTG